MYDSDRRQYISGTVDFDDLIDTAVSLATDMPDNQQYERGIAELIASLPVPTGSDDSEVVASLVLRLFKAEKAR